MQQKQQIGQPYPGVNSNVVMTIGEKALEQRL